MKQNTKRHIAALLAVVMAVAVCLVAAGCDESEIPSSTTESTPLGTLPGSDVTTTTDSGAPVVTTTTQNSQPTETTTNGGAVVTPPTGNYINPLTGMPTENNVAGIRPLAIVVDNNVNSHKNQTGLDQADVLYEALVAPGITRFLAVYSDYRAVDSVCNIRSGRDYHLDWASFHNAVLMCHGASNTTNYDFYSLAVQRLGSRWGFVDTQFEYYFSSTEAGMKYGTIANWDERLDLRYDTLYKPAAFDMLLKSATSYFTKDGGTIAGSAKQSLKFLSYNQPKDMSGASTATTVDLSFTCQGAILSEKVQFVYNADLGKYLRYQEGQAHVDAETKQQLSFKNVLVLLTDVKSVPTGISNDPYMTLVETKNTEGIGYYFTDGKVIQIGWYNDGNDFILVDPYGSDLTLNAGNTYIGYLDKALTSKGQFWS